VPLRLRLLKILSVGQLCFDNPTNCPDAAITFSGINFHNGTDRWTIGDVYLFDCFKVIHRKQCFALGQLIL
jgi:hypothetical protein